MIPGAVCCRWNLYHCAVTADILTETATAMVETGLKDSGYLYVNRSACFPAASRWCKIALLTDPSPALPARLFCLSSIEYVQR